MREAELRYHSAKLLLRRLHRKIYVARSPEGERVLVKENANILEARREMRVMKAYGRAEHLVELLGYEERDGKAFIVMEWVPGKTLNNLIRKHGKLPVDRVLAIAAQILQGVDVLHRLGYVHGDLHGGNVMVSSLKDPRVKLIDMQMAADKGRTGRAKARRRVVSPPAHLAPESGGTWIDDRYDIYGVGFMMACMMSGKVLKKPLNCRNVGPAGTVSPLWEVVCRAVESDPSKRYPSAAHMAAALHSAWRQVALRWGAC